MTFNQILNLISLSITLFFGVFSLIWPQIAARLLHFNLPDGRAVAEMRIALGAFLIGVPLAILVVRDPAMNKTLAGIWLCSAITRILSIVLDRPALTADYLGTVVLEITLTIFSAV